MSEPGRELREEIERLGNFAEADLDAIRRDFEAEVRALTSRLGSRPEELMHRIGEAVAEFHKRIEVRLSRLQARLDVRFGSPPRKRRRPYVERFPPRTPKPRGKRPSAGGVPVKPDSPKGLSGGAAVSIESD